MNRSPMGSHGPKNGSRYFNVRANNSQSYLNGLKAIKPGCSNSLSQGKRSNFKMPGMKMGINMKRMRGM